MYKGKVSQKSTNGKKLSSRTRFRADDKLRKMSFLKNNNLTLKTRRAKSIVKKVMNHASCFSNYTVMTAQEWRFSYRKNCSIFHKTFHAVKELLYVLSLCKKCLHWELFRSAFSRIWSEYGEIATIFPYSVRMRENADQNNSKYGHFLRSGFRCLGSCD